MDYKLTFLFAYCAAHVFCLLYSIVLLSRLGRDIGRDQEITFFRIMLVLLVFYSVGEMLWGIGNFGHSSVLNRFNIEISVVNHFMVIGMCYYWFCYIEARLHSIIVDRYQLRLITAIPFVVALIVTASSPWTGLVFYLSPDLEASRGVAYVPVLVIAYGYAVVATVRAIVAGVRSTDRTQRVELFTLASFSVPPAVAGILDAFIPFMPIAAPAFFFSFLVIFTMLQDTQISNDSLTGLNNRRRAERHLDNLIAEASNFDPVYFLSIDCNSFKEINDTYGHLEGDRALCIVADALRDACQNNNALVARWGGDEFVAMARKADVGSPEDLAHSIQDCLIYECMRHEVPYRLSVSIGYAVCKHPKISKRRLMEEADMNLYRRKQEYKSKAARSLQSTL